MADYYPTLSRAVAGLPRNDAQARGDLYARARAIVADELRRRDRQDPAAAIRERAALEAAIGKVEAELRLSGAPRKPAATPPAKRNGARDTAARGKATATTLAKILNALQPEETKVGAGRPDRVKKDSAAATAPADAEAAMADPKALITEELRAAPSSLGIMLSGIAYGAAATAFIGVTYIRCVVWLYQGVIGYPMFFAVMAIALGFFIAPPIALWRKAWTLPSFDAVLRFIYSASRHVL